MKFCKNIFTNLLSLIFLSIIMFVVPIFSQTATIASYPMPSCYTSSTIYGLKAGGVSIPVINYTSDYDYA